MMNLIRHIWQRMTGSEIEALDMALGYSCRAGKITAEDAGAYLHHAIECESAGVTRKNWPEFFGRETWKALPNHQI